MSEPPRPLDKETDDTPQEDKLDPQILLLAQRLRGSKDPRARDLIPLSKDERRRIAERALNASSSARAVDARRSTARFRRWLPFALAAALGAAAGVALWLSAPTRLEPTDRYALHLTGEQPTRGDAPEDAAEPVRIEPATRLVLRIEPKSPAPGASLRVLLTRGGSARLMKLFYENDGEGRFALDKPAREALGDQENGPAELVFVIGAPMPSEDTLLRLATDPSEAPPPGAWISRRAVIFSSWGGARRLDPADIEFAGCSAMTVDQTCERRPSGKLVVWAPLEPASATVLIDGAAGLCEVTSVAGGARWTIQPPDDARSLELTSPRLDSPFRLTLGRSLRSPALDEAERLKSENRLDEAQRELRKLSEDPSPVVQLAVLRLHARIERRRGTPEGAARAAALLREAITRAEAMGRLSDAIEDMHLLAYQAMVRGGEDLDAQGLLTAAHDKEASCPPWRVDGDLYRGLLAQERGRYGAGFASLEAALRSATRLGLSDIEGAVLPPLADFMSIWGRDDDAARLLDKATQLAAADPCSRGAALSNRAWAEHRAARSPARRQLALELAEGAVRALHGMRCGESLGTAFTNLAFAQVAAGQAADARRSLKEAKEASSENHRLALWADRLETEIQLAEDPASALVAAKKLARGLGENADPELAFEAAFAEAMALDALGREEAAAPAYKKAILSLRRWGGSAPLGEGRLTFFERERGALEAWVDFWVRRAEVSSGPEEARQAAMLAAARAVRASLGQFVATLLSEDSGSSPVEGPEEPEPTGRDAPTLSLLLHPVRSGWVAIAVEPSGRASMRRLADFNPGGAPAYLSAELLDPFAEQIGAAASIRVFADRALYRVSFEALPWKGGRLIERVSVRYGLGVSAPRPSEAEERSCVDEPFVLVVADPRGDLGGARRVDQALRELLGARVVSLVGERATKQNVIHTLSDPCIHIFEYDGHARFRGRDGIDAALELVDGPLSAAELLDPAIVPRVPETAILAGCETAQEEGLGVARAFLSRGTRQVLASTERIGDRIAERLVIALYKQAPPSPGEPWDVARALHVVASAPGVSGVDPGDWGRVRVLTP